jgi:FkbM family methyltransferase
MRLYQAGARGLAVDANQRLVNAYAKLRPRDICVCACVSDRTGEGVLTIAKQDAMSTVSDEFAEDFLSHDKVKDRIPIEYVSAQRLFDMHNVPKDLDLLNVDVEGHDLEVLRSLDLTVYRPRLIVVEMHGARNDLESLMGDDVYLYLTTNGYRLCAFATMNGYFKRQEPPASSIDSDA